MTINEHATVFFGQQIKDYNGPDDWSGPKFAYRLRVDYDSEKGALEECLADLAQHPDAAKLKALVIGFWGTESDSSSVGVVASLMSHNDRFTGLRAIFLGDIVMEENEISWIVQSDVTPLLKAYDQLEELRVRGGNELKLSKLKHDALRRLTIETGGLPRSVIREVCRCDFPALEHLELWLGTDNYGWDGGVEDLQPILSGKLFPRLQYLGLRDSEVADEVAAVVANAPILQRIEVLDLSLGNLSDSGAKALLTLAKDCKLKKLDVSHHYLSEGMVKRLKKELPCEVVADARQEADGEWRSVAVSE